jgi:diaminopimelate epimerase
MRREDAFYDALIRIKTKVLKQTVEPLSDILYDQVFDNTGEVINRNFVIKGRPFRYCAANIGNPHCVVLCDDISSELAKEFGPHIETNPIFPRKTNVQFMKAVDKKNIQIEIWERGAGYTLASGSSSIASAAVAFRLGMCGNKVTVNMQGGKLDIEFKDDFQATMTGPVAAICDGVLNTDFFKKNRL